MFGGLGPARTDAHLAVGQLSLCCHSDQSNAAAPLHPRGGWAWSLPDKYFLWFWISMLDTSVHHLSESWISIQTPVKVRGRLTMATKKATSHSGAQQILRTADATVFVKFWLVFLLVCRSRVGRAHLADCRAPSQSPSSSRKWSGWSVLCPSLHLPAPHFALMVSATLLVLRAIHNTFAYSHWPAYLFDLTSVTH